MALNYSSFSSAKEGDRIAISFERRDFEVIVINPDGLGPGQPSVGLGFRMGDKHVGVPESTARGWVRDSEGVKSLKLPSGKTFGVREIQGSDGNVYSVIEVSDWFALAVDLLVNPGRTGKRLREKLGDFIGWFGVKGFYSEVYVALKGVYTEKDSRATSKWIESRQAGIPARKSYTDLLQAEGCESTQYGVWTNLIYQGLFGLSSKEMKAQWDIVSGSKSVARNYVSEAIGLDAIRFCEDMVVRIFVDDLQESHDTAIALTRKKYLSKLAVQIPKDIYKTT